MRRQPVAFFLGDAAFLSDSKFRALARRLTDPDEFNSAVGAFFIALAHARRNGVPDVDVAEETQSRFVPDLIAVGLLLPTGFRPDPFKDWAPSRPPRPNELGTKVTSVTKETKSTDPTHSDASTPLYSVPINSEDDGEREAVPSGEVEVLAWLSEHGCYIKEGNGFHQKLVLALERHPAGSILQTLERLSVIGVRNGDIKGFLFGAIDALDRESRPSLVDAAIEEMAAEQEKAKRGRWERSQARLAEYRQMIEPPKAVS